MRDAGGRKQLASTQLSEHRSALTDTIGTILINSHLRTLYRLSSLVSLLALELLDALLEDRHLLEVAVVALVGSQTWPRP